ncbi:unnamed protein product [Phaedon cochleariae]|uniref:CRAL-TRIO domain-containing protein n=1 Tax=Phaedon cochleariae TaxID=80249 RepID=A0A9P0DKE1_PHACE|nr:unnamed protein product [Phaedon cochleariae]
MVLKTGFACESTQCSMMAPCENHLEIIRNDIGENEARLENSEVILFKWIDCQQHFPKNYDKNFVRNFLRGSKHDMERTKQRLETHFATKSSFPGIFKNRIVDQELVDIFNAVNIFPLPKLTKDGHRLLVFKIQENDLKKIDFNLSLKIFFMIYDVLLKNYNPVAKEIAIFDCEHSSSVHIMNALISIRNHMQLLRQCYAIRLKEIHVVKAHSAVEKSVAFLKPVLHAKIRNSFIFHQDANSLVDRFGEDILPSNYGGKCKSFSELTEDWLEILRENEGWFREQEQVEIDSSMMPREKMSCVYFEDQIGTEGSFRKLEID